MSGMLSIRSFISALSRERASSAFLRAVMSLVTPQMPTISPLPSWSAILVVITQRGLPSG